VLHHLLVGAEALDSTASGLSAWLQDPGVSVPVDIVLRVLLLELRKQLKDDIHVRVLLGVFLGDYLGALGWRFETLIVLIIVLLFPVAIFHGKVVVRIVIIIVCVLVLSLLYCCVGFLRCLLLA